jgi:lysophospholipase L1-like esterase
MRIYRGVALAVSLFVGAGVVEIAVRARQWIRFGSTETSLYRSTVDPGSGLTVPAPRQSTSRIGINSLGFRGPEIPLPKPTGVIRLAFLGGSTTFCAEVSGDDVTWPALVTKAFSERWPSVQFDYVNAAFPGYVVETNRRNLRHRVVPTSPDIIVLYEAVNDLSHDLREMAASQGISRGNVDDDNLLGKWSLAWSLIEKNIRLKMRQYRAKHATTSRVRFEPAALSAGFEERLNQLVGESQLVAPIVAVATFSQKVRQDQTAAERLRNAVTHVYYMPYLDPDDIVPTFAEYNRAIRQTAAERGVILIGDEDTIPATDRYFADSVHFTDEGSRAMAARVARALVSSEAVAELVAGKGQGSASRLPRVH